VNRGGKEKYIHSEEGMLREYAIIAGQPLN